jgi:hypothetical protein
MAEFVVSYTEENWYRVIIEAETEQEARDKFWEFDFDQESAKLTGEEIQEGIYVEELV